MRYIVTFLVMTFLFSCQSDKKLETGELTVTGKYCKYPNNDFIVLPFQLFKNDVKVQSDTLEFSGEIKLKDLSFGKYSVKFKSIYERQEIIEFEVNSKAQEIQLCIDKLDYDLTNNSLLIDQLKPNEKLKIDFFTFGCFHSEETGLEIIRTKDQYLVKRDESEIVLSANQIKLIREFEIELRQVPTGYCTTSDTYNLTIVGSPENMELIDESCAWNGFSNLLVKLGLKNNYS